MVVVNNHPQKIKGFGGSWEITSIHQENRHAVALDIKYDPIGMNILGTQGFLQHLYQVCRLRPGKACLFAPVCSTFVFMNLVILPGTFFWIQSLTHLESVYLCEG